MKFKTALSLIILIGTALFGVNWRLNNPPLSDADKEFRAAIAGADSVEIQQDVKEDSLSPLSSLLPFADLDAEQTHQFVEKIRLSDNSTHKFNPKPLASLILIFKRKGKPIHTFILWQNPRFNQLLDENIELRSHEIHPRFEKPLRQFLDQIAPSRIRP